MNPFMAMKPTSERPKAALGPSPAPASVLPAAAAGHLASASGLGALSPQAAPRSATPAAAHQPPAGALHRALGHWAEVPAASRAATTTPPASARLVSNVMPGGAKLGKLPFPQEGGLGGPDCKGPPELGTLSARYESNGDPGTVSTGNGDIGGVSYGSYQMSTASGSAGQFVSGSPYANDFAGLQPGTSAFSDKWREIAGRDPAGFQAAQHEYIKENYYDVQSNRLQQDLGLDPNKHSNALQQVIWSTSVQHGAYSSIVEDALAGRDVSKLSEADMINAIYAERGRTDENGNLVHFSGSSWDVQQGVANRFRNEDADAISMLQSEQQCSTPQSP